VAVVRLRSLPQTKSTSLKHVVSRRLQHLAVAFSAGHTIHYNAPSRLDPLSLESSGTGFQRRTFPFLGSRTVPATQPQQHFTPPAATASSCPVRSNNDSLLQLRLLLELYVRISEVLPCTIYLGFQNVRVAETK
jgi:hypothetical protein